MKIIIDTHETDDCSQILRVLGAYDKISTNIIAIRYMIITHNQRPVDEQEANLQKTLELIAQNIQELEGLF